MLYARSESSPVCAEMIAYARSESSPVCAEMIAAVQADIRDSRCTGGHM